MWNRVIGAIFKEEQSGSPHTKPVPPGTWEQVGSSIPGQHVDRSWILLHQSDHLLVHALRGILTPVVVEVVPVGEVLVTNEVGDAWE